jgi:hypothetical protein
MRRFRILPDGIIQGGTAYYDYADGLITYDVEVDVKLFIFTQTKKYHGVYEVDPAIVKAAAFDEIGETQLIGNVEFTVLSIDGNEATVAIRVLDQDMAGVALVGLSDPELIAILSLNAKAAVMGMTLNLSLVAA